MDAAYATYLVRYCIGLKLSFFQNVESSASGMLSLERKSHNLHLHTLIEWASTRLERIRRA